MENDNLETTPLENLTPPPTTKWYKRHIVIIIVFLVSFLIITAGIYYSVTKQIRKDLLTVQTEIVPQTKNESVSQLPEVFFGLGFDNKYILVNTQTNEITPFIPEGFSLLNQWSYSKFPTYLILQKGNNLYSYNVQSKQLTQITTSDKLSLQKNEKAGVYPSITEKSGFYVEINTFDPKDTGNEMGIGPEPLSSRSYVYDALNNSLKPTKTIKHSFQDCYNYDSLNKRFFTWKCGEGIGSALPLSTENLDGTGSKVIFSPKEFGSPGDSYNIHIEYNNEEFIALSDQFSSSSTIKIVTLNPNSIVPEKTEYTVNESVIPAIKEAGIYSMAMNKDSKTIIIGTGTGMLLLHYNEQNQIYESKKVPDDNIYPNFIFSHQNRLYYHSDISKTIKIIDLDLWELEKTIPIEQSEEEITLFSF